MLDKGGWGDTQSVKVEKNQTADRNFGPRIKEGLTLYNQQSRG